VDPSRRLERLVEKLGEERLPLSVEKLDVGARFGEYVARHAGDAAAVRAVTGSRFFPYLTERLPSLHEYVAVEVISQEVTSGRFDHVVVDTPRIAHALHFLAAPERLGRMAGVAARVSVAGRMAGLPRLSPVISRGLSFFLGRSFLAELLEFFGAFARLWPRFSESAAAGAQVLSEQTSYGVVVVPEPRSAAGLADALAAAGGGPELSFAVVNRVLEVPAGTERAAELREELTGWMAGQGWPRGGAAAGAAGVVEACALARAIGDAQAEAGAALRRSLRVPEGMVVTVPWVPGGIGTLEDLQALGGI
jgi:anion-transporting  ArsA/GET3 family ATPase